MKKRGFNIVFQDYALFPNLNAYDNIVYGLRNKKGTVSKQEVQEYIDFLELQPHLDKRIGELSGAEAESGPGQNAGHETENPAAR